MAKPDFDLYNFAESEKIDFLFVDYLRHETGKIIMFKKIRERPVKTMESYYEEKAFLLKKIFGVNSLDELKKQHPELELQIEYVNRAIKDFKEAVDASGKDDEPEMEKEMQILCDAVIYKESDPGFQKFLREKEAKKEAGENARGREKAS